MATLTIRNLREEVKTRLRLRAAGNGRSMEEEARRILGDAVGTPSVPDPEENLVDAIRRRFAPLGGVDLDLPPREMGRDPPDFSGPDYNPPDEPPKGPPSHGGRTS